MLKLERKEKGTMLFKDIVDAKRCAFFNDAVDWRDAIRKSCIPLKKTGCATADYEERIRTQQKVLQVSPRLPLPSQNLKSRYPLTPRTGKKTPRFSSH